MFIPFVVNKDEYNISQGQLKNFSETNPGDNV